MLELTQQQQQTLDAAAHDHFEVRLRAVAAHIVLAAGGGGVEPARIAVIRERGAVLGLVSERAQAAWLLVAVLLGPEFEQRHPWSAAILADMGNGTVDERAQLLLRASCQERVRAQTAAPDLEEKVRAALQLFSTGAPSGGYERSLHGHAGLHLEALRFIGAAALHVGGGERNDEWHWTLRPSSPPVGDSSRQIRSLACAAGAPIEIALSLRIDPPPQRAERVVIRARSDSGLQLQGHCRVTPKRAREPGSVSLTVGGDCWPAQVQAYEPLVLEWTAAVDGLPEQWLTRTTQPIYLLLQEPADPLDWTAVALSCTVAAGCTTAGALKQRVAAAAATTRTVRRRSDGAQLQRQDDIAAVDPVIDPLRNTADFKGAADFRGPADLEGVVRLSLEAWQQLWQAALSAHGA